MSVSWRALDPALQEKVSTMIQCHATAEAFSLQSVSNILLGLANMNVLWQELPPSLTKELRVMAADHLLEATKKFTEQMQPFKRAEGNVTLNFISLLEHNPLNDPQFVARNLCEW